MSNTIFLVCISIFFALPVLGQDTLKLQEVKVSAYPLSRPGFLHTSSTSTVSSSEINITGEESVLTAVNAAPGVRMEERSPGSYRFSIRGSLLRSPFGIRNIKFYLDGYPLTDAGGNTYFNLADKYLYDQIEIIKGPDGSFYGANTGGAVLLKTGLPINDSTLSGKVTLSYGSFNTIYKSVGTGFKKNRYSASILASIYSSDGYRENSRMERFNLFLNQKIKYTENNSLGILLLIGNLNYRTPGGLRSDQAANDPQQARTASGIFKSAVEQKAGVSNKTYFAGISNVINLDSKNSNATYLSFTSTQFDNPFITNYEERDENTFSLRNVTTFRAEIFAIPLRFTIGPEFQVTHSSIHNYGNVSGQRDTVQSAGEIINRQVFIFGGISLDPFTNFTVDVSASVNKSSVNFNPLAPAGEEIKRDFNLELMPRVAAIYSLSENLNCRISVSRGYSVPTLAELRPSTTIFSTTLQPESGWNYELGFRARTPGSRLTLDISGFYFQLEDAIVRRVDNNENEYFLNAGGTSQPGLEAQASTEIIQQNSQSIIESLKFNISYSFNDFRFRDYQTAGSDFSNNHLTGTPQNVLSSSLVLDLRHHYSLFINQYYNSSIFLNDANTASDDDFCVVDLTAEKLFSLKKLELKFSAGIRNLTGENYSLGNDLNAAGARYYNPAPPQNYFGRIVVAF